jgi:hypothetical protein
MVPPILPFFIPRVAREPQEVPREPRLRCAPVRISGGHSLGRVGVLSVRETYADGVRRTPPTPACNLPRQSLWSRRERVAELRIDRGSEC